MRVWCLALGSAAPCSLSLERHLSVRASPLLHLQACSPPSPPCRASLPPPCWRWHRAQRSAVRRSPQHWCSSACARAFLCCRKRSGRRTQHRHVEGAAIDVRLIVQLAAWQLVWQACEQAGSQARSIAPRNTLALSLQPPETPLPRPPRCSRCCKWRCTPKQTLHTLTTSLPSGWGSWRGLATRGGAAWPAGRTRRRCWTGWRLWS